MLRRRQTIVLLAAGLFGAGSAAQQVPQPPADVRRYLPSAVLAGETRFRYWGFAVYDASLWVQPGFQPEQYERFGFALDLRYLRDFSSEDITRRSIEEMRRQADAPAERWPLWQEWLRASFPDVRQGDRITGIHLPGTGSVFLTNGRRTGAVSDAEFARRFFGIWLGQSTSEPALRQSLLGTLANKP